MWQVKLLPTQLVPLAPPAPSLAGDAEGGNRCRDERKGRDGTSLGGGSDLGGGGAFSTMEALESVSSSPPLQ